ncbi:MAG: hypothetical protein FJ214_01225 [Ignavibacteria bacterium]|nr:hypothetical protein [Ignavibacteria bacterium]
MNVLSTALSKSNVKAITIDIIALLVISFTPAISHMLSVPIYLLEPMRILAIISLIHTSKNNTYLIALILPLFSYLISSHPSIFKTLLIFSELSLNVWLFFFLVKRINNLFLAMFSSILISKFYYYTLKLGLLSTGLIDGVLLSTPIYLQIIVAVTLSVYTHFLFKKVN